MLQRNNSYISIARRQRLSYILTILLNASQNGAKQSETLRSSFRQNKNSDVSFFLDLTPTVSARPAQSLQQSSPCRPEPTAKEITTALLVAPTRRREARTTVRNCSDCGQRQRIAPWYLSFGNRTASHYSCDSLLVQTPTRTAVTTIPTITEARTTTVARDTLATRRVEAKSKYLVPAPVDKDPFSKGCDSLTLVARSRSGILLACDLLLT